MKVTQDFSFLLFSQILSNVLVVLALAAVSLRWLVLWFVFRAASSLIVSLAELTDGVCFIFLGCLNEQNSNSRRLLLTYFPFLRDKKRVFIYHDWNAFCSGQLLAAAGGFFCLFSVIW